ncbi:MAG: AtpZ/AtpI family protein [Polyangiaceae bacterium]|nr:AtpZ/AtpI family protein [Polyangiaceae bacterium]MCW5792223.1 AtpZ/AtpI family protein [Polyangiaceae bacterium]
MQQDWKALGNYGTVGLEFVLSILFGLWVGQALDGWLGTEPWMTGFWLCIGLAAGVRALIRTARQATREAEEIERKEREARKRYHDQHSPPR